MAREFRTADSYKAERATRKVLVRFLEERGFTNVVDHRTSHGPAESQILKATDDRGKPVAMWVRLGWRRKGDDKPRADFSAAQLLAKIKDDDWIGTLQHRIEREKAQGATHLLLVQREKAKMVYAASIPIDAVIPIWVRQRDISERLIKKGTLGRRRKNHAMNGSSPTLWLRDTRAPEVGEALWKYRGVRDLAKLPMVDTATALPVTDDSMDDLPGVDYSQLGGDGGAPVQRVVSGVKRDPKVRKVVLKLSEGKCERCGDHRDYSGFLDVHHILGADKSDRVYNCVAVCPNCHREAHASPDRDAINGKLLVIAGKHKSNKASAKVPPLGVSGAA